MMRDLLSAEAAQGMVEYLLTVSMVIMMIAGLVAAMRHVLLNGP
jgi:hypothetical protein